MESVEEFVMPPKSDRPVEVSEEEPEGGPQPVSVDEDRVDELLRQFRERYGK
jgi:hypothetical protein